MSKPLKPRRGTTAEHADFIGQAHEVTYDTDKHTLVTHDGVTPGGFPLARADEVAAKDAAQDKAIAEALDKVGLPLGFEYTRLTGESAPLGGVDYMGQTATRAMYADLWAWLNEHKPDAIVSESDWQALYSSQNGNVAKYSAGDGSTTFRFPRVMGYFKGAGSTDELGQYTPEGLPNITGAMNTFEQFGLNDSASTFGAIDTVASATGKYASFGSSNATRVSGLSFDASRSNPIFGNSPHVTPETVAIVMGVIAFGSVASIGEATEEGIVAELGEHGAKLGELEAEVDEKFSTVVPAGFVMPFAANSTPSGYLLCNGAAVSRTTYKALFDAIGTIYGAGDGSSTFNLPDLRGRYIEGQNASPVGTYWEAGLPDIEGHMTGYTFRDWGFSGPFYETYRNTNSAFQSSNVISGVSVQFKASYANPIYGASGTVQPPAVTMRYYIKY